MRPDMKTVVTERPRSGGGIKTPKGSRRELQRQDPEDQPKSEKIRQKWKKDYDSEKQFTDVLGPIYGYLLKQVGRPWDKVYSEIVANLPKGTVTNDHIYSHIWQFVEKNVILIDGVPCYGEGFVYGSPLSGSFRSSQFQMYVHPVNELLCKVKQDPRKQRVFKGWSKEQYAPGVKVYPGIQYHKVKGIWYEVKVKRFGPPPNALFPVSPSSNIYDEVLDRYYANNEELKRVYGGMLIAQSKRPLNPKEIKQNRLEDVVQNVVK